MKTRRQRHLWVAPALVASVAVGACSSRNDTSRAPRSRAAAGEPLRAVSPADEGARRLPRGAELLRTSGRRPVLPKWKTAAERTVERLFQAASGKGLAHIDQFDDYRRNNLARFYVTNAPATPGVRAPAEHDPSQAYLLQWQTGLGPSRDAIYREMVKGAWGVVPVILVHEDAAHKARLEQELVAAGLNPADATRVGWFQHAMSSIWVRDSGPLAIVGDAAAPKVSFVDFRYFHTRVLDDVVPTDLAAAWGVNVFRPDLDFEPGNFMTTSDGLCAASKGVLWFNLQFTQSAVEQVFKDYLGCKKTLFPTPLKGEGTTHIDMFAKFGPDASVLVGEYASSQDAGNKAILDANAALFAAATTGTGLPVKVTRIPMPDNNGGFAGKIWRTYTNSIALASPDGSKKVLLIPVYSDEASREATALAAYSAAFPGWTQTKIDSKEIIGWGGAMHCIAMQLPVGQRAKLEADAQERCSPKSVRCARASCGNIRASGCCEGDLLKYCSSQGKLEALDCSGEPQCGWDGQNGWYDCAQQATSDPSGKNPRTCGVLTDGAVPDGGGHDAGTSTGNCGRVSYEGCCDGERLRFCENNLLQTMDCAGNPKCGWDPTNGAYDCGTDGGVDPRGVSPKSCVGLLPDAGPSTRDASGAPEGGTRADAASADGTAPAGDARASADLSTPSADAGGVRVDAGKERAGQGCSCDVAAPPSATGAFSLLGLLVLGRCRRGRRAPRRSPDR
ncbi:MAG: agmatine deiminase family protein [Deltaproteobacteria bacterium]|nr:agmatine deiminase family protein [Deltaproteobacteria bacterium]